MAFNLKKLKKFALDALQDVGVQPMYNVKPVDRNSIDWKVAVKNFLSLHPEYTDIDHFLRDNPKYTEEQIMQDGLKMNPKDLQNAADQVGDTETAIRQITQQSKKDVKTSSVFNLKDLKKAQGINSLQGLTEDYNANPDYVEQQEERLNNMQDVQETGRKFDSHESLKNYLLKFVNTKNPFAEAWKFLQSESPSKPDDTASAIKMFYDGIATKSQENILEDAKIIYDNLYGSEGESTMIPAKKTHIGEVEEIIKKLAGEYSHQETKAFNLQKTAQHKTLQNTILWNAGEKRTVDPFLRQPVSDWHIVERNKGFGLVVGDVWNIDWETLWRENVMDKYSRPYRDKDGNWVGGYIQKRFEVDKNIPETSNYQLKPGQKRKPILPQYGNIESRLQYARSEGQIEGAEDKSAPFNWKEASKKKS